MRMSDELKRELPRDARRFWRTAEWNWCDIPSLLQLVSAAVVWLHFAYRRFPRCLAWYILNPFRSLARIPMHCCLMHATWYLSLLDDYMTKSIQPSRESSRRICPLSPAIQSPTRPKPPQTRRLHIWGDYPHDTAMTITLRDALYINVAWMPSLSTLVSLVRMPSLHFEQHYSRRLHLSTKKVSASSSSSS
jgi:hypothetical protein